MNDDVQRLRRLTTGRHIFAAIMALFACFLFIYVIIRLIFLLDSPPSPGGVEFMSRAIKLIYAVIISSVAAPCGLTLAALIFAAGRSLVARKRRMFCIVIAAICCAIFPLGTPLGVFTILVLSRPEVKAMFQQQAAVGHPQESVPRSVAWRDETFVERSDD